jgi:lipopolysaccharide/colanic/teichoic acid biosynthesis glycosyltransferase
MLLATAVAVRCTSRGPVLFRQQRVGLNGELFTLWKFRTMVRDAPEQKATLSDANEAAGVLFKLRRDPRITPVGRFLRRFSIDELPQLFHVLSGKMSLVGPRPPVPDEVARYEADVHRRLLVKPGLTGLWQVSGRSNLPWDEAIRLDLYYVDHWSPGMDFAILLKTLSAVIRGVGAY